MKLKISIGGNYDGSKNWKRSQNNYKLGKRFDKKLYITVFYQCILGTENNYIQEMQAETIYVVNPSVF